MSSAMRRWPLVLGGFALAASAVRAQQYPAQAAPQAACPWLTQGSAARVLGAEVTVAVHLSDAGLGTCTFTVMQKPDEFLKIEVSKSALPSCAANSTKLKGIGNEAMRCRLPGSTAENAEMISSRVRDLYFTLTLMPDAKSSANPADRQDDAFELSAELVAGNLF